MQTRYNKLIRDKIPEIIKAHGGQADYAVLSDAEYLAELDRKLNEEVAEYQESKELEELADILEVLHAICEARGYSIDQLHKVKQAKALERGGFAKKLYLKSVEKP